MHNDGTSDGRIEVLKKREADIRAKIAAERVRQQRRKEKEFERLKTIVGGALLANAAQHPDFELMLKQTLQTAVMPDTDRAFLKGKGWQ